MCSAHVGHYKATGPACLRQPNKVQPGQNVVLAQPQIIKPRA